MMSKKIWLFVLSAFALVLLAGVQLTARADEGQRFVVSVDNIANFTFTDSGAFNTPVGAAGPGPLLPGQAYEWRFNAQQGERLSFATMFVQSNDWFVAPDEQGIPLYNADSSPRSGDVTAYVKLWDAGTEGDETPGEGANQAPRQAGPNSGPADPNNTVRRVLSAAVPAANELVRVTVTPVGNGRFILRIQNISDSSNFVTPFAPGVGVTHSRPAPLFVNGQADWGVGLKALAEDGNPGALADYLAAHTGINTPLAPVAWTVQPGSNELFASGQRASAGLESLAEDGSPTALAAEVADSNSGAAAVPTGSGQPGPIFPPAGNYSFEITAVPGDKLSLATMFVQSNDWFFGLNGAPLFDANGSPISGDVTAGVRIYDAGTEVDETPGLGLNQAPRQAGPNTGAAQGGVVQPVDGLNAANYAHITITPVN